jgi:hypothetical protein
LARPFAGLSRSRSSFAPLRRFRRVRASACRPVRGEFELVAGDALGRVQFEWPSAQPRAYEVLRWLLAWHRGQAAEAGRADVPPGGIAAAVVT